MRRPNPGHAANVAAMTRRGYTAVQIAAHLRISPRTVIRYRAATGTTRPPPTPLTDQQLRRARQLLEDGASYCETARTIGCAYQTLTRRFPGYGWTQAQTVAYRHDRTRLEQLI